MLPVQDYIDHFLEIWDYSPDSLPEFPKEYSTEEKLKRETSCRAYQNKIKKLQNVRDVNRVKEDPARSFFPMLKSFLETVFDFDAGHLSIILSDEFKDVSKDFFYKARAFGPELKPEDIYQGMRNVWIMNGLQLVAKLPVKITPSVFAYSMIYPYSDNLLDDPEIDNAEKIMFSKRFDKRLHGELIESGNFSEKQLYRLISLIEEEFPRDRFPKVYQSLYAIQQGQTNSLKLTPQNGLSDPEICKICFEKGGASVLADGYLAVGNLTKKQERALFGYGIYLQLLDDIQDVNEDSIAATTTMFSRLCAEDMASFVNKTIHFGRIALNEMQCFEGTSGNDFLGLMNRSIEMMLIESVGLNDSWYSTDFLQEIEKFSPLHFSFIKKSRSENRSLRFSFLQKYFDSANLKTAAV